MKVKIGDKTYNLKVSETPEEREKGLKGVEKLNSDEGMIFILDEPETVKFWMKDTKVPLDIIYFNEDDEIMSINRGVPMSEKFIEGHNIFYVIELNQGSGVKITDKIEFIDEEDDKTPIMKILAPDGSTLMELEGGERIVSRRETKILIKKAKKAYLSKSDNDYKSLGKYIFKVFKNQDNRQPEYVDNPK